MSGRPGLSFVKATSIPPWSPGTAQLSSPPTKYEQPPFRWRAQNSLGYTPPHSFETTNGSGTFSRLARHMKMITNNDNGKSFSFYSQFDDLSAKPLNRNTNLRHER